MKAKNFKRAVIAFATICMLFLAGFAAYSTTSNPKATKADGCQPQNVMICGATDRANMVTQINSGDGTHTDIKSIFAQIGITPEDVAGADTVPGSVTQDGRVLVNNQVVASGVIMGERPTAGVGGVPFAGLTWNPISIRFAPGISQGAYVHIVNGHFTWAVITSCGNPVLVNFAQQQSMTITKEVKNNTQSGTYGNSTNANVGDIVRFRVHATNNGDSTISNVTLRDTLPNNLTLETGSAQVTFQQLVNNQWQTVTQTIPDAEVASGHNVGSLQPTQDAFLIFNAKVMSGPSSGCSNFVDTGIASSTETGSVQATATVVVCVQAPTTTTTVPQTTTTIPTVTTTIPPSPRPTSPQVTTVTPVTPSGSVAVSPSRLPISGPVDALAGVLGTASLGSAGYLYQRSRKKLKDTMRKK